MPEITSNKYLVTATWDDAPHLSQAEKDALWDSIPAHEREARARGIPSLGSGAVWPIAEERFRVEWFEIPEYWPRAYALDVGWNNTACIWGAWDQQSDIVYIWSEYKQSEAEPATHVEAIKSRGAWIPGVIDPASRGRSQKDGERLLDEYEGMGLDLDFADNSVDTGLFKVEKRLRDGRLKIFDTCRLFFDEFRLYRRNEKGKIVKVNDHLCDCLRYIIMSGIQRARIEIDATDDWQEEAAVGNSTTGY